MTHGALTGVVVVERAGRLGGAVCATLLAEMGARVIRLEHPEWHNRFEPEFWRNHPLALAGKTRLAADKLSAADMAALEARADVVIQSTSGDGPVDPAGPIRCEITAFGRGSDTPWPNDSIEPAIQATGGLMATTGNRGGPPEVTQVPIMECFAAVNAATSVLAALRVTERGGPAQLIDIAVHDASVSLIGNFIGSVISGKGSGYRGGATHNLSVPWNAYPTADGMVMLCSSTGGQWERLAAMIGRPELATDPRFIDMNARVANRDEVDRLMSEWIRVRPTDEVLRTIEEFGVPIGPIPHIPELPEGDVIVPPVETRRFRMPDSTEITLPASPVRLSRTAPITVPEIEDVLDSAAAVLGELGPKPAKPDQWDGTLPLAGVRVVEIGPFTAGPLGGRFLANLGAEVIKVEPLEGESCRTWKPLFGGISGYFATYNAGKKATTLNLRDPDDKEKLWSLIEKADVILQNLKPGALEKMGFGREAVAKRRPGLVYASVSGYGADGPGSPALDTVAQARSGLMTLAGEPGAETPIKVGFSVGDLMASHMSPFMILSALRHSERSGEGQHCDYSMRDGLAWITQLAWPDGNTAMPPLTRIECGDGWAVALADADATSRALAVKTPDGAARTDGSREAAVAALARAGIEAVPVLELDEVLALPQIRGRAMLVDLPGAEGAPVPISGSPHRLMLTPPRLGSVMGPPGADNEKIFGMETKARKRAS